MVNVAIAGATGYTGEELIHILLRHSHARIKALSAVIDRPTDISEVFPRFKGRTDMICKDLDASEVIRSADVVFLALPHTVSMQYAAFFLNAGKKVIDLSADYRLPADVYEKWYGKPHCDKDNLRRAVYGLPELYRKKIKDAMLVANPGCYPTSVILGIAPLVKAGLVGAGGIIADSKSGISGAGRKASVGLLFAEVAENFKAYKIASHQHEPEIAQELAKLAGREMPTLFVPHVIPVKRGILSTIYAKLSRKADTAEVTALYEDFYEKEPFVRVSHTDIAPELKDVINTNYCDIGVKVAKDTAVVVSVIDNLTKGAAGQAVQNMNIMCGLEEKEGLI